MYSRKILYVTFLIRNVREFDTRKSVSILPRIRDRSTCYFAKVFCRIA